MSARPFVTVDGTVIKDVHDLHNALQDMDNTVYNHHVNHDKNDFSAWLSYKGYPLLSSTISSAGTPQESVDLMKKFLNFVQNQESQEAPSSSISQESSSVAPPKELPKLEPRPPQQVIAHPSPEHKSQEVNPTFITELDTMLQGGIPKGAIVLLAGPAGTGKTTLAMQWLYNGVQKADEEGLYLALTEPITKTVKNASSFEFYKPAGEGANVHLTDLRSVMRLLKLDGKLTQEDANKILDAIKDLVERTKAKRLVIDSITALCYLLEDRNLIRYFIFRLGTLLSESGCTTFFTSEITGASVSIFGVEEFISDGIIRMSRTTDKGQMERTIQIVKMRGLNADTNSHNLRITSRGVEILLSPKIPLVYLAPSDRISTGNKKLDRLVSGGVPRGSTTLLAGATGTGKTSLSTQFIVDGLAKNEPCLYASFEESENQITRNAKGYGWDLSTHKESGLLVMRCTYAREKVLEEHLIDIQRIVEEKKIKRCVFDSLSAVANYFPEHAFSVFAKSINGYFKSRGVTSFFTTVTASLLGATTLTESNVSTVTDNIVMLRYVEIQGELQQVLNIVKIRGSSHSKGLHKYTITDKGLVIGQSLTGYEGVLTGVTRKVSATIEERLEKEFNKFIGPMAVTIFPTIKKEGLTEKIIFKSVDELIAKGVLQETEASIFKKNIRAILNNMSELESYTPKPQEIEKSFWHKVNPWVRE